MSLYHQLYNGRTNSHEAVNTLNKPITTTTNNNIITNNNVMTNNSSNGNNNNNNFVNGAELISCITPSIDEKPSPIVQLRKSSDQSTIPSPPLSPYQRNAELISTKSTVPISLISSRLLLGDDDDEEEQSVANKKKKPILRNFTHDEFPLEDLSRRTLAINAWSDISKPSFKQNHLKFLSNYQFYRHGTSASSSSSRVSKRYNTIPRTRRIVVHSDVDSSSDFEKIRTRRIARETATPVSSNAGNGGSTVTSTAPSTPQPVKRPRKPRAETPSSPVIIDYESVPDFCPPLSTLPNNNKCLRQEWKGQPMNLSNDPLLSKLHPAELTLASILRLPCSMYLDSKRRLFLEKVNRTKRNLPFRRTDAQKLCKIDVNKASRLFAAFEKVGWLNESHFKKYL